MNMSRTKLKEAISLNTGVELTVKGWVRAFRSNRFIALNDGSCLANLQLVIDFEKFRFIKCSIDCYKLLNCRRIIYSIKPNYIVENFLHKSH